jgi:Tol biopolymer transport system component
LYFTHNGGITTDGEYMWIRCAEWPSRAIRYGVVSLNPDDPFFRVFNNVTFDTTLLNPIPGTHKAIFGVANKVYEVDVEGNTREILTVDEEFIHGRKIEWLSTHLSLNSDSELIVLDMYIGGKSYVAIGNYKTGELKHIYKTERHLNHAQFSPTDPKLFIVDQDWVKDWHSGERFDVDQRIWLMDVDETRLEPIDPGNWFRHNNSIYCHDFWSADGWICWPDLLEYVYEYNVYTKEKNMVWKRSVCHAHTLDRRLWVGDATPYGWNPCDVVFFDRDSGKEINIFTSLPLPKYDKSVYHLDPHPAFSPDGNFIVSMTTVKYGEIDIAITPVASLLELCRKKGNTSE